MSGAGRRRYWFPKANHVTWVREVPCPNPHFRTFVLRQSGRKSAAETGKAAGAVDQDLIPDAARVLVNYVISGEVEALADEIIHDVLDVIGDASAGIVFDDDDDVAMGRRG
jgi:hypothetical protein